MTAVTDFVRSAEEHGISLMERTYDLHQIALNRTFLDVNPFCRTIVHANDKHSFTCAHHTRIRNKQDGLLRPYGPLDGRIHARSQASVRIDYVKFDWHSASLRIDGTGDSS